MPAGPLAAARLPSVIESHEGGPAAASVRAQSMELAMVTLKDRRCLRRTAKGLDGEATEPIIILEQPDSSTHILRSETSAAVFAAH